MSHSTEGLLPCFKNKNATRKNENATYFLLLCGFILMLEKQSQFCKLLATHCHLHAKAQ